MFITNEWRTLEGQGRWGGGGRNKENPATSGTLNFTLAQQGSLQFFLHQKLKKKKT